MLSDLSQLAYNNRIKSLTHSYGLDVMNVTWEDCARNKNSSWGPNISDMTLCVNNTRMPVIRKPNMADLTTDIDIEKFSVIVGNESSKNLSKISLKEYLENISKYTGNNNVSNMYLPRDNKILTSSQVCILPLHNGEVEFNVKLYNYQTSKSNPAVLVILASAQGTSCQVIDSTDTNLYFNNGGFASNFLAKRLQEDRTERKVCLDGPMTQEEQDRNVLYIFQIPLKRKYQNLILENCSFDSCNDKSFILKKKRCSLDSLGMDNAVLRAGNSHGKYKNLDNVELERDTAYPIRCTLQFYKVTDTIEIPEGEIATMAEQIKSLGNLSSLVHSNTNRITEHIKKMPPAPSNFFSGLFSFGK